MHPGWKLVGDAAILPSFVCVQKWKSWTSIGWIDGGREEREKQDG